MPIAPLEERVHKISTKTLRKACGKRAKNSYNFRNLNGRSRLSHRLHNSQRKQRLAALVIAIPTENSLSNVIDVTRFSCYYRLLRVTARVVAAVLTREAKPSLRNIANLVEAPALKNAEYLWIKEAQPIRRWKVQTTLCKKKRRWNHCGGWKNPKISRVQLR